MIAHITDHGYLREYRYFIWFSNK